VSARTPRQVPYGQWFHTVLDHFSLDIIDEHALRSGTAQTAYNLAELQAALQ
jgi:hypothetical protein